MQCQSFEQRLHEMLDLHQRPDLDECLQRHAQQCKACRRDLSAASLMVQVLCAKPAACEELIASRLSSNVSVPFKRRRHQEVLSNGLRMSFAALSALATVWLMSLAFTSLLPFGGGTAESLPSQTSVAQLPPVGIIADVSGQMLIGASSPVSRAAVIPAIGRRNVPSAVPGLISVSQPVMGAQLLAVANWERAWEVPGRFGIQRPTVALQTNWVQQVTAGIQPVAQSLDSVWAVLRQSVIPEQPALRPVAATAPPA